MASKEIITLQFGHYSNFVGTHWWNIQESSFEYSPGIKSEINHDVLFREGQNDKGQITYTPRLLLVDLKGSLKALPETSELYENIPDPSDVNIEWNKVEIKQEPREPKSEFQKQFDAGKGLSAREQINSEDVRVWSDFLYTRFHPRTVNVIKEYNHNAVEPAFDVYPLGQELWKGQQFQDDYCDKIRNYVEECDNMQGFQILFDSTDGFSGLASSCIEYLKDEFEKMLLTFPLIPSFYPDYKYEADEQRHKMLVKDSQRVLNLAFCFDSLRENSSLFVPLSTCTDGWRQPGSKTDFYHVQYNSDLHYHTSSILASALDTFTLKYRLKDLNYSLQDLKVDLTVHERRAAAATVCLPFSFNSDAYFIDCLDNWQGPLSKSITPRYNLGSERMMQLYTLRGIPEDRLKKPAAVAGKQKNMPAYACNSLEEMLNLYLSCQYHATASNVTVVNKSLPTRLPYPQIFDPMVGPNGYIQATERLPNAAVESVPVLAGLHNGSEVGHVIESLHTEARKVKFQKFHHFVDNGIEVDDFNECLDRLFDFRECYEDNYLF